MDMFLLIWIISWRRRGSLVWGWSVLSLTWYNSCEHIFFSNLTVIILSLLINWSFYCWLRISSFNMFNLWIFSTFFSSYTVHCIYLADRISSFKMFVWKFTCILHVIFLLVFLHNRNPNCNLKPQNWELKLTSTSYNALVASNYTDSNKTFSRWRKSSTNCWKNKANKSRTSGRWHISSQ